MGTNIFGYIYDPIGNRKTTDHGQLNTTYLANELNQYLLVTNASHTSSLSYDGDGNLTNDGTFAYIWSEMGTHLNIRQLGVDEGAMA